MIFRPEWKRLSKFDDSIIFKFAFTAEFAFVDKFELLEFRLNSKSQFKR